MLLNHLGCQTRGSKCCLRHPTQLLRLIFDDCMGVLCECAHNAGGGSGVFITTYRYYWYVVMNTPERCMMPLASTAHEMCFSGLTAHIFL